MAVLTRKYKRDGRGRATSYTVQTRATNDMFFTGIIRQLQKHRRAWEWLIKKLSETEIYYEKALKLHKRRKERPVDQESYRTAPY